MSNWGREAIVFLEIDQPLCSLVYGESPCAAVLGVTGARKCYNSRFTCQDAANYTPGTLTLLIARAQLDLLQYGNVIPSLIDVSTTPMAINLGGMDESMSAFGRRETVSVSLQDHQWDDHLVDKYRLERAFVPGQYSQTFEPDMFRRPFGEPGIARREFFGYFDPALQPYERGTFWGKWLARNPYHPGYAARIRFGYLNEDLILVPAETVTEETGTAGGGSADTLLLSLVGSSVDGAHSGKTLRLLTGPGSVQERTVSAYDGALKAATVSPGWSRNALTKSSAIDHANWTQENGITITANAAAAPDGTIKAERVQTDGISLARYFQTVTGYAGKTVCFSLKMRSNTGANQNVSIHLRETGFGTTYKTESKVVTPEWHTFSISVAIPGGSAGVMALVYDSSASLVWDFFACEHQVNEGSAPDVFIETDTAAITLPDSSTTYELIHNKPAYYTTPSLAEMLADMRVKHYVIDRIEGPNEGQVRVVLKDVFSLVEAKKAVAPLASLGELDANITNVATSATLSPAGIGNLEYPASGHIAIGDEICAFTRSGDSLTLTRAQLNTEAAAHDAEDLVQLVLSYSAQLVHDIIYHLLTTYGGIATALIDKPRWDSLAQGLTELYTGRITKPTPVNELVGELMLQAGCTVWPDVSTGMIEFRALQAGTVSPVVDDDAWLAADRSLSIKRQDAKRVSQVWVYYGQIRPNEDLEEKRNFRSRSVTIDLAAEGVQQYGTPAIREIFSRWIPQFGRSSAERCGERLLAMFRDAPLEATLPLHASRDGQLNLAQYFSLKTADVQDDVGGMQLVTMAPVEIESTDTDIEVRAQQVTFGTLEVGGERVIYIENDALNLNLRDIHDSLYAAPTGSEVVRFILMDAVAVGSTSTATYAVDTGEWPVMATPIELNVIGRGQGKGGQGGSGGPAGANPGLTGGPALKVRAPLFLTGNGKIWSGAGGGGGAANSGGGGGAGTNPGDGGFGTNDSGDVGTADAGGAGGIFLSNVAGTGGGPGLAGSSGTGSFGQTGGPAGPAIDGVSLVTFDSPNLLDIRGAQIN